MNSRRSPRRTFWRLLLLTIAPVFCAFAHHPDNAPPLFQNRFFTLSQDNQLICTTSEKQFKSPAELRAIIAYYEKNAADLRQHSVAVLTDHIHPLHLQDLLEFREDCADTPSPDLCVLEKYWDSEESALRVLALFYDTKTIIKHSDDYLIPRFKDDHLRVFEKGIRKIPPFLRKTITRAKPINKLEKAIAKAPAHLQSLILEASPEDYETSIWTDHTHPLTIVPGTGFRSQTVAQVYNGQNLIIFTIRGFDKAKDGKMYRDIDLKYLVDFRLPILIHEIAHTIDNFHFWNGSDDLYFFTGIEKCPPTTPRRNVFSTPNWRCGLPSGLKPSNTSGKSMKAAITAGYRKNWPNWSPNMC
nr:hypothetical protein [Methylomarinum sp. Ch1-1]MDP4522419.1 hypothetical protein [Methylomarinum sp. Ch1-1]